MPDGGMTIGRLAKAAGVHVETIRYYQRRGLLDEPPKPHSGHRRYPPAVLQRIGFIRRAQGFGFSLAEVEGLLRYADGRNARETRQIAEKKLGNLNLHIAQLRKMRDGLKALVDKSIAAKGQGLCPIITALNQPD